MKGKLVNEHNKFKGHFKLVTAQENLMNNNIHQKKPTLFLKLVKKNSNRYVSLKFGDQNPVKRHTQRPCTQLTRV